MFIDTHWNGVSVCQHMVFKSEAEALSYIEKMGDDDEIIWKAERDTQTPGYVINGYEADGYHVGRL